MDIDVTPRAPQVRCYECGSLDTKALCHHCWRPGCAQHVRPSPAWAAKLLGKEGSGPALGKIRACHCADCAHVRVGRWLELGVAGAALAIAGLFAALLNLLVGLLLVVVGGASAAWAYGYLRRRSARARTGLPVALHPKVAEVRLLERLRVRITLGSRGDYRTELDPVEGELRVVLTLGRLDRERVGRLIRKKPAAPDGDLGFTAGRLGLLGPFGIKVGSEIPGAVLPLDSGISGHPVFRAENAPASSQWRMRLQYELSADPDIWAGPFWITPSIVPESNKHALELDIQWVEFGPDEDKPLTLDVIKLLRLRFPVTWGTVQQVSHPAVQGPLSVQPAGGHGVCLIEWKQLSPTEDERREQRLTIAIQFEHQITREDELSGDLEADMKGTLSGVQGVRLYSALGARRAYSGLAKVGTRIEAAFALSLASIRYQAVRVVPDRAEEDSDHSSYADEFDIIPDDETVIALTNAMSKEDYYVKRVIENPPRSGGRANQVQRYWDIAGRAYKGIYPVDFHLMLVGEEVHRGDIRPETGTTKVRIVVSGAYTDNDDDGYTHIANVWGQLRALTKETLKGQASPGRAPDSD